MRTRVAGVGGWLRNSLVVTAVVVGSAAFGLEIDVRGIASPRPELLARALEDDEEVLRSSTPAVTDERMAMAVSKQARLALQRQGYPEPQVSSTVEAAEGLRRVVVTVDHGSRFVAGGIEITGLPEPLAERLRERLTTPQPPASAKPRVVDAGNAKTLVWLNDQGRPARLNAPLWSPGEPAALDAPYTETVQTLVARFLRDEGYLHAAERLKQSRYADCEIAVHLPKTAEADTATLAIRFAALPPASTLQAVEVTGGESVAAATVREFLDITNGMPVTEMDRQRWDEQLRQSGRFVRHEISLRMGDAAEGSVTAVFDLIAYPGVSPLGEPLTREEEVMLRFRDWLADSLAGSGLKITWTQPAGGAEASCLLSADHGAMLQVAGHAGAGGALAFTDAGVGVFLGGGAGRFELPLSAMGQAVVQAALSVRDTVDPKTGHYRHDLSLGASIGSSTSEDDPAAVVTARIEPVACIAFVHRASAADGPGQEISWEGDTLVLARDGGVARFDGASGQLLELVTPEFGRIRLEQAGSWQTALADLRGVSGDNAYVQERPVSSAIGFFSSSSARGLLGEALGVFGVKAETVGGEQADLWAAVAGAVKAAAADGGFAEVDGLVSAFLTTPRSDEETPKIPSPKGDEAGGDPLMRALAKISGKAWSWLDQTCGRDAWPTGLARLGNAVLRQDGGAMFQEVTMYMGSEETGPLAHLVAASVIPMKPVAASFAMRGQTRMTAKAFQNDCVPIMQIFEKSGLDLALVSTLRRLDADALDHLGESLLGSREGVAALLEPLHAAASDEAAVAAVPDGLAAWWDASLGGTVSLALEQRGGTAIATRPDGDETLRR